MQKCTDHLNWSTPTPIKLSHHTEQPLLSICMPSYLDTILLQFWHPSFSCCWWTAKVFKNLTMNNSLVSRGDQLAPKTTTSTSKYPKPIGEQPLQQTTIFRNSLPKTRSPPQPHETRIPDYSHGSGVQNDGPSFLYLKKRQIPFHHFYNI